MAFYLLHEWALFESVFEIFTSLDSLFSLSLQSMFDSPVSAVPLFVSLFLSLFLSAFLVDSSALRNNECDVYSEILVYLLFKPWRSCAACII